MICVTLLAFWMVYLNAQVREGFEGRRFSIPARVYSEAQELYAGAPIRQADMIRLLDQLGYRRVSDPVQAGRYAVGTRTIEVYTRGFRFLDGVEPAHRLRMTFDDSASRSLTDRQGQRVLLNLLDPMYPR